MASGRQSMGKRCGRRAAAPSRAAGFTAVELVMVMAIVATFAAIAMPSFIDTVRNNRLLTTSEMLQADLLIARREAIKRNGRILVCPVKPNAKKDEDLCSTDYSKWSDGWVVCYDLTSNNKCDKDGTANPNPILRRGKLDSTLALTGPNTFVRFNANGNQGPDPSATPPPAAMTFTLKGNTNASVTYKTIVAVTGSILLCKVDPDDPQKCS